MLVVMISSPDITKSVVYFKTSNAQDYGAHAFEGMKPRLNIAYNMKDSVMFLNQITPMAQGRSTEIVSMMERIRTSRLSIKNSLSPPRSNLILCSIHNEYDSSPGHWSLLHNL